MKIVLEYIKIILFMLKLFNKTWQKFLNAKDGYQYDYLFRFSDFEYLRNKLIKETNY